MSDRETTTGFTESELRAVERFLTTRTVPLTYATSVRAGVHGTGVFFRSEGELFLVTAAHVLQGIDPALLGIPDRPYGSAGVWNLGDITIHHPKAHDTFDVAVIELLNPTFVDRVVKQWQFVDEAEVSSDLNLKDEYVIAGYPDEAVEFQDGVLVPKPMLQLFTKPYEGPLEEATPDHDFLLRYGRTGTGVFGAPRPMPNLKGVSGAAVYEVNPPSATVWSPEQILRPAGIQISFKPGAYARVTKWSLVAHLISLVRERRVPVGKKEV